MPKKREAGPIIILGVGKKSYMRHGMVYARCRTSRGTRLFCATPELVVEFLRLNKEALQDAKVVPIARQAR